MCWLSLDKNPKAKDFRLEKEDRRPEANQENKS